MVILATVIGEAATIAAVHAAMKPFIAFGAAITALSGCTGTAHRYSVQGPLSTEVAAKELSAAWDIVYGSGFYLAHVLGTPINRATLTGSKGTTLQVEYGDVLPRTTGAARSLRASPNTTVAISTS